MKAHTTTKDATITEKLTAHIIAECSTIDMEKRYDEMLDECTEACGFCKQWGASRVLKEMDPVAYRCGFADFTDSHRDEVCEIGSDYYDRREVDKAKESFIDDLNDELATLQKEVDELNEEQEGQEDNTAEYDRLQTEIDELEKQVAAKEAEIAEAEACEF